jgi:acetyl esterase/lipase
MRRFVLRVTIAIVLLVALVLATASFSPWPAVLALRLLFDSEAALAMAALRPRIPPGLIEHPDLAYGPDPRERLDLILPPGPAPPGGWPIIVWVHGGAFISGSKENVANYLRLLSEQGYATVAPNYTLAPTGRHPSPTNQMLEALLWLRAAAPGYNLDPGRLILAGDSAGSHIALQTAIALTDPDYARTLNLRPNQNIPTPLGLVLFCGVYDLADLDMDGAFGGFLRTVLWSYLGTQDAATAPDAPLFSLLSHLPRNLPPLFLTAGNADPLLPQTAALANAASARDIPVETLLFPADHQPALGHEYQFTLDRDGATALTRLLDFLSRLTAKEGNPT